MTLPSSWDQIGKPGVELSNDIDKMEVTMYYLMSSAMDHAFFQKFVKIFLEVGDPVITTDEVGYQYV